MAFQPTGQRHVKQFISNFHQSDLSSADTRYYRQRAHTPANMRSVLLLCALLLLVPGSPARQIQVGEFTFMLDSVLKLKHFLDGFGKDMEAAAKEACHSPVLPEEFRQVCAEDNPADIFISLKAAMDECELCAHPACPGCV
ncbi:guanylate cyclase activator 2B-like isoform X2 [Ranitomeya variabilis]|uniref:guanylate cyclase activator 2B-like isoform X2 n=1 Tax=Ranitomeya variabilis TaxID=490064 RepID=UPI004055FFAD